MLKSLLTLENLWKGLGHITRWVLIPFLVLAAVIAGALIINADSIGLGIKNTVAAALFVFMAVTTLWLCSRWLDWLSETRFKKDVAPLLKQNTLALAIYYTGRWIGLAFLVGTVYATVRF
ncbi:MAG TPA: hypothetical protein VM639_24615 [Dongiaceae bacterium]|nr:hypothetical protein [Dongiaceae bacterium]